MSPGRAAVVSASAFLAMSTALACLAAIISCTALFILGAGAGAEKGAGLVCPLAVEVAVAAVAAVAKDSTDGAALAPEGGEGEQYTAAIRSRTSSRDFLRSAALLLLLLGTILLLLEMWAPDTEAALRGVPGVPTLKLTTAAAAGIAAGMDATAATGADIASSCFSS